MTLSNAIARGRAAFIDRMRATCVIDRLDATTIDDDGRTARARTQIYPDPSRHAGDPHADGKCYVRYPGVAFETNKQSAGVTIVDSRVIVRIPFGPIIRPGDRVRILTDPDNPQLAGSVYRVASIDDQSQATAQRLLCDDLQAGVATSEPEES